MIRYLLAVCAFLVVLEPPLAAQEAEARLVTVRCLAFQIRGRLPELYMHDLAAQNDAAGLPIRLKSYLNHENQTLPLLGKSIVFTTAADQASTADPAKIIANFTVPNDFRQGILMFLPAPKGSPEPTRILAIADHTRDFPAGSVMFLNLAKQTTRVTLEKTIYEFKSGERKVIKDPPVGANQMGAMGAWALQDDAQWKRIGSTNFIAPGPTRSLMVIFENPTSERLEIKGIKDVSVQDS